MAVIKIEKNADETFNVRQKKRGKKDKRVRPVLDVPREHLGEAVKAVVEEMRGITRE